MGECSYNVVMRKERKGDKRQRQEENAQTKPCMEITQEHHPAAAYGGLSPRGDLNPTDLQPEDRDGEPEFSLPSFSWLA